jgi:hypothetical protein
MKGGRILEEQESGRKGESDKSRREGTKKIRNEMGKLKKKKE